jgi:hypothetical protein
MGIENRWQGFAVPEDKSFCFLPEYSSQISLGVPQSLRRDVYLNVTGVSQLFATDPNYYLNMLRSAFGDEIPQKFYRIATFGAPVDVVSRYHLTDIAQQSAGRILNVLSHCNPSLEFCPMLPHYVCYLLTFLMEDECVAVINYLLHHESITFFPRNLVGHTALLSVVKSVLADNGCNKTRKFLSRHNISVSSFLKLFTCDAFASLLPDAMRRVAIDAFLIKGVEAFLRLGIGILQVFSATVDIPPKTKKSPSAILWLMVTFAREPSAERHIQFHREAASLVFPPASAFLSREVTSPASTANASDLSRTILEDTAPTQEVFYQRPEVYVYHRPLVKTDHPSLLSSWEWEAIFFWVPSYFRNMNCELLYEANSDGWLLNRLLAACSSIPFADRAPFLLVAQATVPSSSQEDSQSQGGASFKIGAFFTEALHYSKEFYGSGDTFIFAFQHCNDDDHHLSTHYNWHQGDDECFIATSVEDGITFGCHGGVGWRINPDLTESASEACDTFRSQPLLGQYTHFSLSSLQLYTIT